LPLSCYAFDEKEVACLASSGVGGELPSLSATAGELGGGRGREHDGGRARAEAACTKQ
jgi:hypothetical protein